MLLYRIQNRQTKKFLCGIRWYDGTISWSETGAFFRRPDSINKHLKYLMGEFVAREKDKFPRWTKYNGSLHFEYKEKWDKGRCAYVTKKFRFYKNRLKLYRVVVNDVLVKGEKFIDATKFCKK